MKLLNKIALVTGAGKGIGRGIALEFAKEGADIIVNYSYSEAEALDTVTEIEKQGRRAIAIQADVSQWSEVHTMIDQAWAHFGQIDILVNNAGITPFCDFFEMQEDDWDRAVDINLKGAFMCSQAVAIKQRTAGIPGKIIHIGSIHSRCTVPFVTAYAASKGGMDAMTRQMALALAPYRITVNTIAPGLVEVPRILEDPLYDSDERAKQLPVGRVGLPEDIGKVCVFFASEDSSYITGQILHVDGGQSVKIAMKRGDYE
jgi:NAD(P)-dependent dehydrogenase (short-subunit alcohol dehydrogenase family)